MGNTLEGWSCKRLGNRRLGGQRKNGMENVKEWTGRSTLTTARQVRCQLSIQLLSYSITTEKFEEDLCIFFFFLFHTHTHRVTLPHVLLSVSPVSFDGVDTLVGVDIPATVRVVDTQVDLSVGITCHDTHLSYRLVCAKKQRLALK